MLDCWLRLRAPATLTVPPCSLVAPRWRYSVLATLARATRLPVLDCAGHARPCAVRLLATTLTPA